MDAKRIEELKQIHADYLIQNEKDYREYMRNAKGIGLEKKGKIYEAMAMYELNLDDNYPGLHPYKRLAIIYSKFKNQEDAKRVLNIGILNVTSEQHRQELIKRLNKLHDLN
jgi:hypothetical protein